MDIPEELHRKHGSPRLRRLVRRAAIGALASLGGMLAILAVIFDRVTNSEAWVDRTHDVRLAVEETISALATAEAAQRRYLITRDRGALDLYAAARDRALSSVLELQTLVEPPLGQTDRAARLQSLIERRIAYMEPINQMAQNGDVSLAFDQIREGQGIMLTTQARTLASDMQRDIAAALSEWRGTVQVLRWWFLVAIIGLGLGLAALWGAIFLHAHRAADRERRLRDDLLALLDERTSLLREINHRVGNSLMMISSLIELQARTLSAPQEKEAFLRARARVAAVGEVHRRLQQSETIKSLEFASYLRALCKDLGRSMGAEGNRIRVEAEPVVLPVETVVPLGLIVNELVTNAIRHAYGPERGGEIEVRFDRADRALRLCVRDWGRGLPPQEESAGGLDGTAGLGLPIIRALVGQLDGDLSIEFQDGTLACITFPAPP